MNERFLQVEVKPMTIPYARTPKLTIAKDRVAVKFSPTFPEEKKEKVCSFAIRVAEAFPAPPYTLRGRIKIHNDESLSVSLHESHSGKKTWKCRAEGNVGWVKVETTKLTEEKDDV
jgi:hypothetical protein